MDEFHAAHELEKRLQAVENLRKEYSRLSELLVELPKKTSHPITVPLGKKAFFPGFITQPETTRVLLGENWFVETTTQRAAEICQRRLQDVDEEVDKIKKQVNSESLDQLKDTKEPRIIPRNELNEEGYQFYELREPYTPEMEVSSAPPEPPHSLQQPPVHPKDGFQLTDPEFWKLVDEEERKQQLETQPNVRDTKEIEVLSDDEDEEGDIEMGDMDNENDDGDDVDMDSNAFSGRIHGTFHDRQVVEHETTHVTAQVHDKQANNEAGADALESYIQHKELASEYAAKRAQMGHIERQLEGDSEEEDIVAGAMTRLSIQPMYGTSNKANVQSGQIEIATTATDTSTNAEATSPTLTSPNGKPKLKRRVSFKETVDFNNGETSPLKPIPPSTSDLSLDADPEAEVEDSPRTTRTTRKRSLFKTMMQRSSPSGEGSITSPPGSMSRLTSVTSPPGSMSRLAGVGEGSRPMNDSVVGRDDVGSPSASTNTITSPKEQREQKMSKFKQMMQQTRSTQ